MLWRKIMPTRNASGPSPEQASEQVDPPVVAAKSASSETELALSQPHEPVLLANLVGRSIRHRGEGVDLPELSVRALPSASSIRAGGTIPRRHRVVSGSPARSARRSRP